MSPVHRIILAVVLVAAHFTPARAQMPSHDRPPCAPCVVAAIDAASAAALAADTSVSLARVQLLMSSPVERDTVERLSARGARLVIEGAGLDVAVDRDVLARAGALVFDLRGATEAAEPLAFAIKQRATEARAARTGLQIGIEADATLVAALTALRIAPYVDFAIPASRRLSALPPALAVWVRDSARTGFDAFAPPPDARADRVIRPLDANGVRVLAALHDLLSPSLIPLDSLRVRCTPACQAPFFVDPATLDAVAIVSASVPPRRIQFEPGLAGDARVLVISEEGARREMPLAALGEAAARGGVPARAVVVAPAWGARDAGRFTADVQVRARRRLSVEEIVARHQEARARQQHVLRRLISTGRTLLTFDAPGFPAPVTIAAATVLYARAGLLEVEQRDIRVNGLAIGGGSGVPRLPLIEPERVAVPPLALTLTDAYRYRLEGEEIASGRPCHVVAFESASSDAVRGRAWIAADDFGAVRLEFVQRSPRGPVVSSEQREDFMPGVEQGTVVWLPWRTEIHQMYEGAAHRTPIHRVVEIASHRVNPDDFDARLAAARAGPAVMLRDTPGGFRYLERAPGARPEGVVEAPLRASQRVRTVAFGLIVDPNITRPLPFAGLSYLDFNLFGTGTQVDAFAGAGYGRAAFATAPLAGTRWRVAGDAFAIAARYNDRVFEAGRERYELNLRQRPAQAAVGVMGPLVRSVRLRAAYHVDYTRLERGDTTSPSFVVPASPLVHAARVSIDAQRGAWTAGAWWSPSIRQRWAAWGLASSPAGATDVQASQSRTFQRYGAAIARSFVFSTRAVARADVAWMDGRDLDRFSRYTFGTFDNRLRGYPAASIRYDRGLAAHSAVSWSATPRLRLDALVDVALVEDRAFGRDWRRYPGFGGAVESPLPFGLLAAVEWAYGVRGRTSSGRHGTHVVRVSGYKMF